MPQATTRPRREPSTGRSTAASPGPSFVDADQRLDDAAALHFVVVLADDPFLAGDVERAEDLRSSVAVSRVAGGVRQTSSRCRRRRVNRLAHDRRPAVVQELHRQVGDLAARRYFSCSRPVGTNRPMTVASTPSERHSAAELVPLLGRHGQHHPLLGFGDPDLGVREPLVLQRRPIEPHLGADLLAHLADGAREPAGAAVGDGVIQPAVAGLQQHVEHHLLGDRVADLHGPARERFRSRCVSSAELNVAP